MPKWNQWLSPFLRICKLANHCCVMKNDKGFDIRVDMKENAVLVNDMRKWLLSRKWLIEQVMIMVLTNTFLHLEYIKHELFKDSYLEKRV